MFSHICVLAIVQCVHTKSRPVAQVWSLPEEPVLPVTLTSPISVEAKRSLVGLYQPFCGTRGSQDARLGKNMDVPSAQSQ